MEELIFKLGNEYIKSNKEFLLNSDYSLKAGILILIDDVDWELKN